MTGIDALLASLPAWTLVGGKGGVGKTTCAAALALRSANKGLRTLVLSTDPAGALADVLGIELTGAPQPVASAPLLSAMQLDAATARDAFVARWGEVLATILDRGTYLDRDDIQGLIDGALPGIDETMAVLALADLADANEWDRVIVDTAPTGHTLRLLALPETFNAVVRLLDSMQAKHRFMVSALLHRYKPDAADAFIEEMRAKVARLQALITDRARFAVLLVTRAEGVVVAETIRFAESLETLGATLRGLVVNAAGVGGARDPAAFASIDASLADVPRYTVAPTVVASGMDGLRSWGRRVRRWNVVPARPVKRGRGSAADSKWKRAAPADLTTLPPVLIVGGKGGVGKTSVSCALALVRAREGHATFLVSTDPAPSIADALEQPIGDEDTVVRDGFGLHARQIDATAVFARWREDYRVRVDAAFDGLLGPGLDAAHDRAIARELFALAPPGVDELYALVWLGDALSEGQYDRIVIDPAPTGHLIRLLEMPALALEWSHRLLRLMLKYRELAGGGELSADLLAFARRTRAVGELLRDPWRAGVIVVALDEPIVRRETSRVVERVRALGDHVPAIIWNRAREVPAPLPVELPVRQFVAAEVSPPPVGAARLVRWLEEWKTLELDG
ncbi:MAG TPA: ArsA family ATPase [Gemmatimonadaceae bacterium]|nr:ArsA family ATPase [Gemmatimonadaceae bacterium]